MAVLAVSLLASEEAVAARERPRLAVAPAAAVGERGATLRGNLRVGAGRRVTYRWEYGVRGLVRRTPTRRARATRVTTRLRGLRPGTGYRFRLVASTCGGCPRGTARSRVRTFRTRGRPPVLAPAPAPSPTPPGSTGPAYANPVAGAVADPAVIDSAAGGHDYHLYATGTLFPIWRSPDLVHWTRLGTAFAARPAWVLQTGDWNPWAPGVAHTTAPCPGAASAGCFVLYYTALHGTLTPRPHCVGVAVSPNPGGPFTDRGPLSFADGAVDAAGRPIGCGDDAGYGNIDPQPFVDADGRAYLYVSTDRRCDAGAHDLGHPARRRPDPCGRTAHAAARGRRRVGARGQPAARREPLDRAPRRPLPPPLLRG